ncbi:MAG TPA: hypothetical protein VNA13_01395 [Xanthomonadales bacterium]|nr:hypothetical protein [Xanthomonadales bacterium]
MPAHERDVLKLSEQERFGGLAGRMSEIKGRVPTVPEKHKPLHEKALATSYAQTRQFLVENPPILSLYLRLSTSALVPDEELERKENNLSQLRGYGVLDDESLAAPTEEITFIRFARDLDPSVLTTFRVLFDDISTKKLKTPAKKAHPEKKQVVKKAEKKEGPDISEQRDDFEKLTAKMSHAKTNAETAQEYRDLHVEAFQKILANAREYLQTHPELIKYYDQLRTHASVTKEDLAQLEQSLSFLKVYVDEALLEETDIAEAGEEIKSIKSAIAIDPLALTYFDEYFGDIAHPVTEPAPGAIPTAVPPAAKVEKATGQTADDTPEAKNADVLDFRIEGLDQYHLDLLDFIKEHGRVGTGYIIKHHFGVHIQREAYLQMKKALSTFYKRGLIRHKYNSPFHGPYIDLVPVDPVAAEENESGQKLREEQQEKEAIILGLSPEEIIIVKRTLRVENDNLKRLVANPELAKRLNDEMLNDLVGPRTADLMIDEELSGLLSEEEKQSRFASVFAAKRKSILKKLTENGIEGEFKVFGNTRGGRHRLVVKDEHRAKLLKTVDPKQKTEKAEANPVEEKNLATAGTVVDFGIKESPTLPDSENNFFAGLDNILADETAVAKGIDISPPRKLEPAREEVIIKVLLIIDEIIDEDPAHNVSDYVAHQLAIRIGIAKTAKDITPAVLEKTNRVIDILVAEDYLYTIYDGGVKRFSLDPEPNGENDASGTAMPEEESGELLTKEQLQFAKDAIIYLATFEPNQGDTYAGTVRAVSPNKADGPNIRSVLRMLETIDILVSQQPTKRGRGQKGPRAILPPGKIRDLVQKKPEKIIEELKKRFEAN